MMKRTIFFLLLILGCTLFQSFTIAQAQPKPLLTYVESSIGLSNPSWEGGDSELEFADINLDGHVDIVTIGDHGNPGIQSGEQGIMVYVNDGTGKWSVQMTGNFGYGGIAIGDVNNDGFWDAGYGMHHNYSSTDFGDQLIEVALGDGTPTGWTPWDDGLATAGEDWGMFGTDLGDIDNDGDLDLASISFGCCSGIHVYLNNMNGTWTHSFGTSGDNASDILVMGDINNDGFLDIATAYESGTIWFGDGTGDFTLMDLNLPPAGSVGRYGIAIGDVDNDGGMDLSYVDYSGGIHVYIFEEDTEEWTSWSAGLPSSGGFESTQLCDMNRDGSIDLAAFGEGLFQLYLGDGNGNWTSDASFTTQDPGSVKAFRCGGDVDHNGRPDMSMVLEIGNWPSEKNYLKCYKESSSVFALNIAPVYPGGNELFWQECIRDIKWTSAVPAGQESDVKLEYSVNGPAGPWTLIADGLPNSGRYQWHLPPENSLNCYIRYTVSTANDTAESVTPAAFIITDGTASATEISDKNEILRLFPNPSKGSTTIHFLVTEKARTRIDIISPTGTRINTILDDLLENGSYSVQWDHSDLAGGIYFLRMISGKQYQTIKLIDLD